MVSSTYNKTGTGRIPCKNWDDRIKEFIYDPNTGKCCGRTGEMWAKITIFYILFYFVLGLFFMTLLHIFLTYSISSVRPRWTGTESLVGNTPGLGFRPMPDLDTKSPFLTIKINQKTEFNSSYWAKKLDRFFEEDYRSKTSEYRDCSSTNQNATSKMDNEVNELLCNVDINTSDECSSKNAYGYANMKPCVVIKLNKIIDWIPKCYNKSVFRTIDNNDAFRQQRQLTDENSLEWESIWITCEGETTLDKAKIGNFNNSIQYYNSGQSTKAEFAGRIPNYYFPYKEKNHDYKSPFVFVKFNSLMENTNVRVVCKAWAQNIIHDRNAKQNRLGSVVFQLRIESSTGKNKPTLILIFLVIVHLFN